MKEMESRKEELLPAAFLLKNLNEMKNLLRQGADPTKILPHHMVKMMKDEDFIINMLNIDEIRNQNASTLIEMFVNEDAEKIKSFISFVEKHFYTAHRDKLFQWTRNVRPGFEKFVSKDEGLFYLQRLDSLDGKSIVQYVVDGGDEMVVLREQLLDAIVKIDRKIYYEDSEKESSQDRVIANIKRDIPSSRNLSNCLESLETRYSWGFFQIIGNIANSFALNIALGYTLYGLDIGTDLDYSLDIYGTSCNITEQDVVKGTMDCLGDSVYLQQGIIGFAHVIIPQTVALLIGLFTLSDWVSLPLPLISKGYRFYLDVRHSLFKGIEEPTEDIQDEKLIQTEEERQAFQRRKERYEIEKARHKEDQKRLRRNNRDILMAQQVECTGESSFQFFMQTLWLMPTLMVLWWDKVSSTETANLDDLFNLRTFSVAMSFITMGMSYTSIRSGTIKGR